MRTPPRRCALAVVVTALAVMSCSEPPSAPEVRDVELAAAKAPPTCELVKGISDDARRYFVSNPLRRDATGVVGALSTACSAGDQALVRTHAWTVLEYMETALETGAAGAPAVGSSLANGLLACTTSLCRPSALPGIDFRDALTGPAIFAVRRDGTVPVGSRSPVPFVDWEGTPNSAWWGIQVDAPWSQVTGTNPVLIYGAPIYEGGVDLQDLALADVQFSFALFPDVVSDFGNDLHVGLCLTEEMPIPHQIPGDDTSPELLPTVQREGVILEVNPGFSCEGIADGVQQASLLGSVTGLLERVLPASLSSLLLGDKKTGVVGGTPLDFSDFAVVGAETQGSLVLVQGPDSVVTAGQPVGTMVVQALTGEGTPVEKVSIHWEIFNNSGEPGGAVLSGDTQEITVEYDATLDLYGVATFPDVRVGKAGGYTLCAYGTLAGFQFTPACSSLFHARNAT